MRLAEFILANIEPILAEWEAFARSLAPGATMTIVALRDDAESILLATARDMQNPQSLQQQASKSKGHGGAGGTASDRLDNASDLHVAGQPRDQQHERVGEGGEGAAEVQLAEPGGVEAQRISELDLGHDVLVPLALRVAARARELVEESESHAFLPLSGCRSATRAPGRFHQVDEALGSQRKLAHPNAEREQRVLDGGGDGRGRDHPATLSASLHAVLRERRRRLDVADLEARYLLRRREQVVHGRARGSRIFRPTSPSASRGGMLRSFSVMRSRICAAERRPAIFKTLASGGGEGRVRGRAILLALASGALAAFAVDASQSCEAPRGFQPNGRLESSDVVVLFRTVPPTIEIGRHFTVEAVVCSRAPAPMPTRLRVDALMPEHRHGMPRFPSLRKVSIRICCSSGDE